MFFGQMTFNNQLYVTDFLTYSASDYYPFGMVMPGRQFQSASGYRYGFNGMEKDDEVKGVGNHVDFGARGLDTRLGRWWSVDPLAVKYPFASPYNFALNTPIQAKDPDGKDVYLVIWATANGEIGHAGIAVENYKTIKEAVLDVHGNQVYNKFGEAVYKTQKVKDGTVTYYDLWPGNDGGVGATNANTNVEAEYNVITTTLDELIQTDITGAEDRVPDGVVELKTDADTDAATVKALNKFKSANTSYNGVQCNCSDFAEAGVETAVGKDLDVNESILGIYNSTTPNKLYKETANQPNAKVLKDPGDKVNNSFVEGVKGGN